MPLETKDLDPVITGITEIKAEQKTNATAIGEVKTLAEEAKKTATETKGVVDTIQTETTELKTWRTTKDEADKKNQEFIDKMAAERKRRPFGGSEKEVKSFNDIIGEAIEKNADKISGYGKGQPEIKMDLMPEVKETGKEGKREVKAVGDMSVSVNFPTAGTSNMFADMRTADLIRQPYNRVWLSDILPNGSSNGRSVLYPKENGQDGAAALWEDPTTDKPQVDFNLTTQTAYFKWIAGIVIVDRDMLDDIPFLLSYIQNKMLISLKTAENAFILNGAVTQSEKVTGLRFAATAYTGSQTDAVKILLDAAWGQIVEDTNEFYSPTHAILRPRDAVNKIGLHQASGSGEFDLPAGSVAFSNGKLQVGGLDVVTTSQIPSNDFLVLDAAATMFIRRMVPELRLFEDATLAKKNKVMFRIEERATLAIFNNNAIVSGTLAGGASW